MSEPNPPAKLRGKVEILPLDLVKPNDWNPNRVPEHIMASIRHGFRTDGWLLSQALLIWATDEVADERNVIIDGEHRWFAARDVGLAEGPMVRLYNLPEVEAKALTVKLNQKRGEWDNESLIRLVAELEPYIGADNLSTDLGFTDEESAALVALGTGGFAPGNVSADDVMDEVPEIDPEEFAAFVDAPPGQDRVTVPFRLGHFAGIVSADIYKHFEQVHKQVRAEVGDGGGVMLDLVLRRWLRVE